MNGRDFYLGPWGTKASHAEYDRLMAEWLANGRRAPRGSTVDMTVAEVLLLYMRHAEVYFAVPAGGILASVDPKGQGFSQKLGYFELRAKFPSSLGMWPAFWLLGQPSLTDRTRTNIEIDVVEHYGVNPYAIHSTMHLWYPGGKHTAKGDVIAAPGLTESFHNYGVMVDEANVTWYFDGIEVQKQKTPEEAKVPLYMLVNLAMGGGWPIDKAISPSYMYVDYVRAYRRR